MLAVTPSQTGTTFLLALACLGHALALSPDPSGQSKIGNGAHQSFIGSQCVSSLDCGGGGNTACCAFLPQAGGPTIGICSGCAATTQAGKQGCGFGDDGTSVAGQPQVCPASSFAQATTPTTGAVQPSGPPAAPAPASSAASPASSSSATNCMRTTFHKRRRSAKQEQRQAAQKPAPRGLPPLDARQQPLPDHSLDDLAGNGRHAQFVSGRCTAAADCGAAQPDLSRVCCASVVDAATGQTVGVCSGSAVGNAAPKLGCGFADGLASAALAAGPAAAPAVSSSSSCDEAMGAPLPSNAAPVVVGAAAPAPLLEAPPVSQPPPAGPLLPDPGLDKNRGNQQNKQFVSGACINAQDCGAGQADLKNVCCASVPSNGQVVGVCSGSAVGDAAPKMGCGFGDGKVNAGS